MPTSIGEAQGNELKGAVKETVFIRPAMQLSPA